MADILIKGMEMPVQCVSCPMWSLEGIGDGRYMDLCRVMMAPLSNPYKRPSNCPLIALPDNHGPLIDADKLMRHYAWWGECERKDLFDSIVEQQDTIVPAEKEDT